MCVLLLAETIVGRFELLIMVNIDSDTYNFLHVNVVNVYISFDFERSLISLCIFRAFTCMYTMCSSRMCIVFFTAYVVLLGKLYVKKHNLRVI